MFYSDSILKGIMEGKGIPPLDKNLGEMPNTTLKRKPNTTKRNQLELKVSITDIKQFRLILNIFNRIVTDDRIDKEIRMEYLSELTENISR